MTRQAAVERAAEVGPARRSSSRRCATSGTPRIRSRGTIGGTIAHADPAARDPGRAARARRRGRRAGPGGERDDPGRRALRQPTSRRRSRPDEVLTEVRFPSRRPAALRRSQEVARKQGDFALAGAVVAVDVDDDGVCGSARIALFGVADRPVRATGAEQALAGAAARRRGRAPQRLAQARGRGIDPTATSHASAEYRKEVAGVLVRRALATRRRREVLLSAARALVEGRGRRPADGQRRRAARHRGAAACCSPTSCATSSG